jgi:hypothetical protein
MRLPKTRAGRIRLRQHQQMSDAVMTMDHGRTHYFTVFRLTDDVCAKCGKPRAEHPKRKA